MIHGDLGDASWFFHPHDLRIHHSFGGLNGHIPETDLRPEISVSCRFTYRQVTDKQAVYSVPKEKASNFLDKAGLTSLTLAQAMEDWAQIGIICWTQHFQFSLGISLTLWCKIVLENFERHVKDGEKETCWS